MRLVQCIENTQAQTFLGRYGTVAHQQVLGPGSASSAAQIVGRAQVRAQANGRVAAAQKNLIGGQHDIGTETQAQATTAQRTLNGTDDWNGQVGQCLHGGVEQAQNLCNQLRQLLAVLYKLTDVAAHAELLAGGGNQHGTNIGPAGLLDYSSQGVSHGRADDIALIGLIEHDVAHAVANFPEHHFRHQASFLS